MSIIPQALLCFILLFVTWWWWKINKSSTLIINWPIVGMMPGLFYNVNRLHKFLTDLLIKNGGTFVFKGPWIAARLDMVFTSNADNVHYMLSKNFGNYSKGPDYQEVFEPLGNGILVASGKNWKIQRRALHTVFRDNRFELARERATKQKILNGLFLLLDQASELGSQLDIQDLLKRFMFDTVCQIVLDFDPNTLSLGLPELDYAKAFKVIQEVTFYRNVLPPVIWKVQRWLQVGQEKRLRKASKIFNNFIYSCITRKREQLARDGSSAANLQKQFNLLSYFMVEYNEDNNNKNDDDDENDELSRAYTKSDKFMRDTACNLVAAGRDSVAAGFAWFLYLVATHPSVEEKILQEMRDVLGKKVQSSENIIPEKEELNKLTYLQASILETLRLYPTVPFDLIFSTGSDTLPSGHQIPANTKVVYMLYSMGRMEQIWGKDCSEFKPERWIEFPQGKIKHVPSYKFIAFNSGPRTCLGKELALEQMKTVASALLWNYRFQVVEGHSVYPANSVILHIKHGLQIRVFKRNV